MGGAGVPPIHRAIVTGAGSGIGRACVLRLAAAGWQVVLVGRRAGPLARVARGLPGSHSIQPCDISDPAAVAVLTADVLRQGRRVDALINAAGTNVPRRSLRELTPADYRRVVEVNLHGAYHCIQAVLPVMRQQRSGTIVNIVSDAGLQASAKAGAAYVASKFGLRGLTQCINAEEGPSGIRACAVHPGDVDTPLLDRRPRPPTRAARECMLRPEDVAEAVWLALNLPSHAVLEEVLIRPRRHA